MIAFSSITQLAQKQIQNLKTGACIGTVIVTSLANTSVEAGTSQATLSISLTIGAVAGSCGIGTAASTYSTATSVSRTANTTQTSVSGNFTGTNGLPVYCSEDFYVSADGGNAGHTYTNAAPTRYLYSPLNVASYKYNLTLGPTAPTSLAGTAASPTWSGTNATTCQVAFTGDAGTRVTAGPAGPGGPGGPGGKVTSIKVTPGAGKVQGTFTSGCYRSGLDEAHDNDDDSVMTTLYIPWGYYIQGPFTAGNYTDTVTYSDTVNLNLFY